LHTSVLVVICFIALEALCVSVRSFLCTWWLINRIEELEHCKILCSLSLFVDDLDIIESHSHALVSEESHSLKALKSISLIPKALS